MAYHDDTVATLEYGQDTNAQAVTVKGIKKVKFEWYCQGESIRGRSTFAISTVSPYCFSDSLIETISKMNQNLSGVAKAFLNAASADLGDFFVSDKNVILRIPAVAPEVGELTVIDDYDELTCIVGQIDHRHFEVFCAQGENDEQREQHAAEQAVSWILSVITSKERFRIQMRGEKIIGGGSWNTESECAGELLDAADECTGELLDSTDEWKEYLWSGQVLHKKRSRSGKQ